MPLLSRAKRPANLIFLITVVLSTSLLILHLGSTLQKPVGPDATPHLSEKLGLRGLRGATQRAESLDGARSLEGRRVVIRTCPRCRLNRLPEIRKFVTELAPLYKRVKVDFIMGEDPTLFLYKFEKQAEKIDMEKMSWKDVVQKLGEFGVLPEQTTPELKSYLQEKNLLVRP